MRRGRILGTAALALALLPAGAARQETLGPPSFVVSDPAHGHATSGTFTAKIQAQDPSLQPKAVMLRIAKGYRLDMRALTAGCTADQAQSFSCPPGSRFGGGHVEGHVEGPLVQPNGRLDFYANLDAFMGPPEQPGDLAAVFFQVVDVASGSRQMVTGRVVPIDDGPYWFAWRFDNIPTTTPGMPPGSNTFIDSIILDAGASRSFVVTKFKKKTVRRHHKRKRIRVKVRKRITYGLFVNPPVCTQELPFSLTVSYNKGAPVSTAGGVTST